MLGPIAHLVRAAVYLSRGPEFEPGPSFGVFWSCYDLYSLSDTGRPVVMSAQCLWKSVRKVMPLKSKAKPIYQHQTIFYSLTYQMQECQVSLQQDKLKCIQDVDHLAEMLSIHLCLNLKMAYLSIGLIQLRNLPSQLGCIIK